MVVGEWFPEVLLGINAFLVQKGSGLSLFRRLLSVAFQRNLLRMVLLGNEWLISILLFSKDQRVQGGSFHLVIWVA